MELQDKIGREDIINKISYLVDNLRKDEHFCLALDGEWGSGKTFVMGMLEEKFRKHPEYLIVKYDAWKNNFYSEPLIAILSCVIDAMQERLSEINGFQEAMKTAGKDALDAFLKSNKQAGKIASFIKVIARVISRFQKPFQKDTTKESISEFKSYQSLLGDIQECLTKIIEYQGGQNNVNKIIILVDEIDRCLPNEQLMVLERLHHLFEVKNCAVIVAMNQSSIASTVHTLYGIKGYEYLRKFFDFTFKLQPDVEPFLGNLLNDILVRISKVEDIKGDFVVAAKSAYECLLYGSKQVMQKIDNRDLKRYNESMDNIINQFGWEKLNPNYLFFIIIALFIRKFISHKFLESSQIVYKQQIINEQIEQENSRGTREVMPYYDYLLEYIGIRREDLPTRIREIYRYQRSNIPEFSWYFNEIIYYSTGKRTANNEMRIYRNMPVIIVEDCQRLVELVILYGGEQERDATNEKQ